MRPRRAYYIRGPKDCPFDMITARNSPARDHFDLIHWHTQFQIVYVESGTFEAFSLSGVTPMEGGDIYIVPSEEIHGGRVTSDGTNWYEIVFSPELVTVPEGHFFHTEFVKPLREGTIRFPRMLRSGDPGYQAVYDHLTRLVKAKKTAPNYRYIVFLETMAICLELAQLAQPADPDSPNSLYGVKGNRDINACSVYISQHYREQITLQDLANYVHLHPNYLCRLFKKYSGQTVFEYIAAIRVSYASQFIRRYNRPLQQIAVECGFNSMSYFTKKFKQHIGLTPYAYSKLYKNR